MNNIDSLTDYQINKRVRLQGTNFDRRRKLTVTEVEVLKFIYKKGIYSLKDLAEVFGVSPATIKYHVDHKFKTLVNFNRSYYDIKPQTKDKFFERIQYKRELVKSGDLQLKGAI